MTSCELPQIRISSPGDLIETVPYLIGFHPSESLVLVGFAGTPAGRGQLVTVTMRVDLPLDPLDEDLLVPLAEAFESSATEAVVAIALTRHLDGDPRDLPRLASLADDLQRDLRGMDLEVLDVLVANETHWWSLCCEHPECCPAEGTPRRLDDSTIAAAATYAGLVALPDRQSLAQTLAGCPAEQRAALEPELAAAEDRVTEAVLCNGLGRLQRGETAALLRTARDLSGRQRGLTTAELARFAVALTDVDVRDAFWMAIDNRSLNADAFLHDLHTRVPAPYDAAPLFLYGWSQWRLGNGTLATMAAELALDSDPGYSAATLLIGAVLRGLDPRTTPYLSRPPRSATARRPA